MSYQIIDEKIIGNKINSSGDFMQIKVVHIVCDSSASIPEPRPEWSAGSRCDVLADSGTVYILSISGEWKQVNFYNRGGSGGDFDPDNYYTKSQTDSIISGKVDKVTGKGLSTEDYTTAEKTKLAGIETGAEVNVQSDWGQSDSTADDFIKNKPTLGSAASRNVGSNIVPYGTELLPSGVIYSELSHKVNKVTGKGLSTEDYTTAEKTKLAGLSNYDDSALQTAISNKVDKVTGKGLSTEDYTTAEKNKLAILSELNTAVVTIDLNSQTWTESANGLFYTGNISVTNLYRALSALITGFSALKPTDNVAVIANSDKTAIRLTASTNTFSNNANITVSVFGRFTS